MLSWGLQLEIVLSGLQEYTSQKEVKKGVGANKDVFKLHKSFVVHLLILPCFALQLPDRSMTLIVLEEASRKNWKFQQVGV